MGFRELVGVEVEAGEDGTAHVLLDAQEQHLNAGGTLHGGVIATLIDVAMGTAVVTAGGEAPATVSLSVTYLEPGSEGVVSAVARVRKRGRRLTLVEAEVVQGQTAVAVALATFAVQG
jgi:uncharacterized protein (TIGR00369 family)